MSNSNGVIKDTIKVVLVIYTLAQLKKNALMSWQLCDGTVMMHMVWCDTTCSNAMDMTLWH
jgi:hypothetical protein